VRNVGENLPPGPSAPAPVQTWRALVKPVEFLEDARREFGGTFTARILRGGTLVFISDPSSLKRLFGADRSNRLPPGRTFTLRPLLGPRSLLLLEGGQHLGRRKMMLPPFHGERMRAYETVMREATEREIESWPTGMPFALHPSMQAITLEVILTAVFGVTDGERRRELSENLVGILATTQSPRALGFAMDLPRRLGMYRNTERMMQRADELLNDEITERRRDPGGAEREDILSMLVAARGEDGEGMDDRELRDQLMTLLLAGHETTATALAWAFDLLFRRPDAMERLREDVKSGADGEYIDAVIDETLRLRPVVPFVGRTLSEAAELGGYELPAETNVMPAIYLTHTREDLYERPYEFMPERFFGERPDTFGWIPFGGGTRRCIGAAFAEFEMKVVLRTVLSRTELRPATDEPEPMVRRNVTLSPKNGTPAVLASRV
jgi:cytochrome P450 family 135